MQSRYSRALAVTREDVELLTNVGDCCVQRAELFHSALHQSEGSIVSLQAWAPVKEIYKYGLQVYSKACANADTRIGDDLGGLLQNWSACLSSFAEVRIRVIFFVTTHDMFVCFCSTQSTQCIVPDENLLQRTPDLQEANEAYRQAQEKLKSAIKFKKTDITLFIALGESFASQAERFTADPASQQQVRQHLDVNQHLLRQPTMRINECQ